MNAMLLIVVSVLLFLIAYVTYGAFLARKWGVDENISTPAHRLHDGVDYVPAKAPVLLGHHFSSIAGAGPIVGPVSAAVFGWLPVFLWIIIGAIFVGGVHDMGSLFASVRNGGKSIGEVIQVTIGSRGKKLFAVFAWLTLLLVVAAFTNIVANTFVSVPEAATSSMLFILLALLFGYFVYRRGLNLFWGSLIGVAALFFCIYLGTVFPLSLSREIWMILLLVYIFIASVTPVWILLQPRDYLNSYLLYAMLAGGLIGIVVLRPTMQLAPVTAFNIDGLTLFPILFVTVACGAVSGFHSLVSSGTSSKQLNSEKDIRLIGYGAMLIEGILAVIAVIAAGYIGADKFKVLLAHGGPVNVFSDGVGNFMAAFGLPIAVGRSFTALAISAFAMTSLDTATRLARFIFQEFFSKPGSEKEQGITNRYAATAITVVCGGALAFCGWQKIWPLFGSANQMLAALALLAVAVWLKRLGKSYVQLVIPMFFMFAVTLAALVQLFFSNQNNYLLAGFALVLFILALVLLQQSFRAFYPKKP